MATLFTEPKVLVPVRDMRGILTSLEKLWRESSITNLISHEKKFNIEFQTIEGRCETWLRGDQLVGIAFNRIKDALYRGWGNNMHFVQYEQLTTNPYETMKGIYNFLQLPYYEHDFNNIEQYTHEDDRIHRMKLHKIKQSITPFSTKYLVSDKYAGITQTLM